MHSRPMCNKLACSTHPLAAARATTGAVLSYTHALVWWAFSPLPLHTPRCVAKHARGVAASMTVNDNDNDDDESIESSTAHTPVPTTGLYTYMHRGG